MDNMLKEWGNIAFVSLNKGIYPFLDYRRLKKVDNQILGGWISEYFHSLFSPLYISEGIALTHFKPKLIVFDLDGTLVDSSSDIATAINNMLVAINQATYPEPQIKLWMGCGAELLIKRALTGQLEPTTEPENLSQAMALFVDFYAAHICVQSQLYPGVIDGLEQLKSTGTKLACVTNKPTQLTLPLLTAIGLKEYFQFIASGDTFIHMKPDPLPLLEAAKSCAVSVEQALMVGDSISDIQAGKQANFKTALVPYGYIGKYTTDELDADYNIDRIDQLFNLFYK